MSILNEALGVVTGPRQEAYGDPVRTCERIGRVWSGIVGLDYDLPASTVSAMMVGLKMVREVSGAGSRDNWVDAAGYAHIGALAREGDREIPFEEPPPEGRTVFEGSDLSRCEDCATSVCGEEGACIQSDLVREGARLRGERLAWEERMRVDLTPFSSRARPRLRVLGGDEAEAAIARLGAECDREERARLGRLGRRIPAGARA